MSGPNGRETLEIETVPLNTYFLKRLLRSHRLPAADVTPKDWLVQHALAWASAAVKAYRSDRAATIPRPEATKPNVAKDDGVAAPAHASPA
jgi:hypothetical protein